MSLGIKNDKNLPFGKILISMQPNILEILSHCHKVSGAIVASRSLPAFAARFSRRRASLESFGEPKREL